MGFIQSVGMQPIQQPSRGEHKTTLSTEVTEMLKDIGINTIRTVRIQHGRHISATLKELAQLPLTHDQQNALQGLGMHGLLVAMFAEDDIKPNYKKELSDLHELLLGEDTIALLKEAFGLSEAPVLMEDNNHHSILFLQESVKQLEDSILRS